MIAIRNLLSAEQLTSIRQKITEEQWVDGRTTAGQQANSVKNNQQLPANSQIVRELEDFVLSVLAQNPVFISAALPLKIFPPMFNRYGVGETYGVHVDNAIRVPPGSSTRIRTDLSATLFLTEPDDYDGGELRVEDHFGSQPVKLAAGDLILYPSTSLHQVTPITRGERVSVVLWLQSMIRDHEQRKILFDLDQSVQSLTMIHGHEALDVMRLSRNYHNLLRLWAET